MCGVPYHAADGYVARLIRGGFKVAICDQMEQPGPGKKLVRREVVRVITPGTATDATVLDARENNYLAAVARHSSGSPIGMAFVDLSTGEFQATELSGPKAEEALRDELQLLHPRETLLPRPQQLFETAKTSLLEGAGGVESRIEDWVFQRDYTERIWREQFGVAELTGFGLDDHPQALTASGAIVHYLRENSARGDDARSVEALGHLDRVRYYEQHETLVLDPVTARNLELVTPIFTEEAGRSGPTTLIAALDETVTGMGARLLRSWILRPLIDFEAMEARLGAVAHLLKQTVVRGEIRKELRGILDLERITSRITLGLASPRELVALRRSLAQLPVLKNFLTPPPAGGSELLRHLHAEIDELADVRERLDRAIADEPPALATEPGMIRAGFHAELDVLAAFAKLAADRGYTRPQFNTSGELLIVAGRHPVIEELLRQRGERFVPNDLCFEPGRQQLLLITGPNMGGKSTYLRQAALIVLMAQMGSFVPARQAKLPITDRLFTRIAASDNLARRRSTFLVEMIEVAVILTHSTPASLVLLDEVGHSTATFDGLSIAC